MKNIKKYSLYLMLIVSLLICYGIWPAIFVMSSKEIQPIASAVSTIAGVLFGFVMASITLFASAKDNTLVKNTILTGYLPKLINRLHLTMGSLLLVCLIFLVILFIPDNWELVVYDTTIKYISIVLIFGLFFLIVSFFLFFESWYRFKDFVRHM